MGQAFFSTQLRAQRADQLIAALQACLPAHVQAAQFAVLVADEACGQALIDRCADWLRQALGGAPVWVLPALGRADTRGDGEQANQQVEATIEILVAPQETSEASVRGFGPIESWGFDALNQTLIPGGGEGAMTSLVVLDPRTPFIPQRLHLLHEAGGGYLRGAISAPSGTYRGPAGLTLGVEPLTLSQVFQGLERLEGDYTITAAQGQIIHEINNEPALEVLAEAAGEILARKLDQLPGFLFPIFPVSPADDQDFLARRITGLGRSSKTFSIDDEVLPGMPFGFARRSGPHVRQAIERGVAELVARAGKARPRGAIYLHDQQRKTAFDGGQQEVDVMRAALQNATGADVPLVAAQVGGIISHNRLYQFASQLILFL